DVDRRQVAGEQIIGKRLTDIARLTNGQGYLVTDEQAYELLWAKLGADRQIDIAERVKVSPYPVSVSVSADGQRVAVASLWSRQLTLLRFEGGESPKLATEHVIDLPFAPRKTLWLEKEQRLIVADGFGGSLGVVDPHQGKFLFERKFPGHNV